MDLDEQNDFKHQNDPVEEHNMTRHCSLFECCTQYECWDCAEVSPGISDSIGPVGCGVSRLSLDNTLQTLYQVQPRRVLLAKQAQKYNSHPTSSGYL